MMVQYIHYDSEINVLKLINQILTYWTQKWSKTNLLVFLQTHQLQMILHTLNLKSFLLLQPLLLIESFSCYIATVV